MPLSVEDRLEIADLLALHGHLMDAGAFDRLGDMFTEDILYDVSSMRDGVRLTGIAAVIEAATALGERNPVAHHTTNIIILGEAPGGAVRCCSKGIAVFADGQTGSVVYEDVLERTAQGWRISIRRVLPRQRPLER